MRSADKKCPFPAFASGFLDTTIESVSPRYSGREVMVLDIIVMALNVAIVLGILFHFVLWFLLDL